MVVAIEESKILAGPPFLPGSSLASAGGVGLHGRDLVRKLSLDSRRGRGKWNRPSNLQLPDWAIQSVNHNSGGGTPPKQEQGILKSSLSNFVCGSTAATQISCTLSPEGSNGQISPCSIGDLSPTEQTEGIFSRVGWRRFSLTEKHAPLLSWRRSSFTERKNNLSSSSDLAVATPKGETQSPSTRGDESRSTSHFAFNRRSFRRKSEPAVPRAVPETPVAPSTPRRWRGPLLLQNEAIFEGDATDIPDGFGILLTSSFAYMGEWRNGMQHGYGVYVCMVSRCRYEGRFVNGAASDFGRLLLLSEGPTYVYGKFTMGRFVPRPSSATLDRNEAVKASSMARSAAETALRRACVATQSAFEELSHEMSAWRCAQSKAAVRVNTESLPLVYPGPLTHLIALKTTVVVDAKPEPTN